MMSLLRAYRFSPIIPDLGFQVHVSSVGWTHVLSCTEVSMSVSDSLPAPDHGHPPPREVQEVPAQQRLISFWKAENWAERSSKCPDCPVVSLTDAYVRCPPFCCLLLHQDSTESEGGGARGAHPHHLVAHALWQGGERPSCCCSSLSDHQQFSHSWLVLGCHVFVLCCRVKTSASPETRRQMSDWDVEPTREAAWGWRRGSKVSYKTSRLVALHSDLSIVDSDLYIHCSQTWKSETSPQILPHWPEYKTIFVSLWILSNT